MDEVSVGEDPPVEKGGSEEEDKGTLGVVVLMTPGGRSGDRGPGEESVS